MVTNKQRIEELERKQRTSLVVFGVVLTLFALVVLVNAFNTYSTADELYGADGIVSRVDGLEQQVAKNNLIMRQVARDTDLILDSVNDLANSFSGKS